MGNYTATDGAGNVSVPVHEDVVENGTALAEISAIKFRSMDDCTLLASLFTVISSAVVGGTKVREDGGWMIQG